MPVITVNWWQGSDRQARRELVAGITEVVARVSGCPDDAVTVIVRDATLDHWGRDGRRADESRPARG
ncbi:4-oxalocrotonate tautomerase family protein [Streptomyces sp. NPDC006134]|uniref:tautomerase family protein n=1 Tax=Streptomyces sp. NPDC006134 TaxID=3154467 RepID=UPI0033D431D1